MTDAKPSPEVLNLAARGQTIAAIKLYRQETGASLTVAKSVVDSLPKGTALSPLNSEPAPPLTQSSGRAGAFLAATILGFIGLAVTGTGLSRSMIAAQWPQANGEILRSEFLSSTSSQANQLRLEYAFEVDGQVHQGTRISFTMIWGGGFTRALESRYPPGQKVEVYYEPSDPTQAVLEIRIPTLYWMTFIGSLIAFVWGLTTWLKEASR